MNLISFLKENKKQIKNNLFCQKINEIEIEDLKYDPIDFYKCQVLFAKTNNYLTQNNHLINLFNKDVYNLKEGQIKVISNELILPREEDKKLLFKVKNTVDDSCSIVWINLKDYRVLIYHKCGEFLQNLRTLEYVSYSVPNIITGYKLSFSYDTIKKEEY